MSNKTEPIKIISITFYLHEDGNISQETLKVNKLNEEDFMAIIDNWYKLIKDNNGKTK